MAEFTFHAAWLQDNARYEEDAAGLWARLDQLPDGADAIRRTKQLSSVAYDGDRLIGVTTGFVDYFAPLRANFVMRRILVDPEYRGKGLMSPLLETAYEAIESWAKANPQARVAGYCGVRQSPHLIKNYHAPEARGDASVLVGFTDEGNKVFVRWFAHYRPA